MPGRLHGLRVAFVVGTGAPGGAERQLFYMLSTLVRRGAHPHVLCLTTGEYWLERYAKLGVPVEWVGASKSHARRLGRILRHLRAIRPHVVQSSHFFANLYAAVAGRLTGVPSIGALRSDLTFDFAATGRVLGHLCLRSPDVLAANSSRGVSRAALSGVQKPLLLPNVVDLAQFPNTARAPSNQCTLVAVGRLIRVKRFDRFLRLVASLRRDLGDDVRGLIVGGDAPKDDCGAELRREAKRLEILGSGITFVGHTPTPEAEYGRANVLVVTSDHEGTPNVALEAMAAGLPVVATNVGGVSDIVVPEKTGSIVEPEREADLFAAVRALVIDPERRRTMGARAREHIERHFSLDALPRYLEGLYDAAIATRGRAAR